MAFVALVAAFGIELLLLLGKLTLTWTYVAIIPVIRCLAR